LGRSTLVTANTWTKKTTEYTKTGAVKAQYEGNGYPRTDYTYDSFGRLLTQTDTGALTTAKAYAYNLLDQRTSMSVSGAAGFSQRYEYDAFNQLSEVYYTLPGQSEALAALYGYDENGALEQTTYGNGVVTDVTRQYNRPVSINAKKGLSDVTNYTYAYFYGGNIKSETDLVQSWASAAYTYDDLNRVTNGSGYWDTKDFRDSDTKKALWGGKVQYATIGAGPSGLAWGTLESGINRGSDVKFSNKVEMINLNLINTITTATVNNLFEYQQYYQAHCAPYTTYYLFPSDYNGSREYNSNSFTHGLLNAAGITAPTPSHNVPGWTNPLSEAMFGKHPKGRR